MFGLSVSYKEPVSFSALDGEIIRFSIVMPLQFVS